jgi:ankyrin repeat protein
MKHISTEYKKKYPHEIVVSYFFDRLGEELQKTLEGYLRHLLARILRRYPALFRCIREFYNSDMLDYVPDPDTGISIDIDWTETSLRAAWDLILENRSYTPKITLFVDAIDECNESREVTITKLFHESCLARFPVSVKVCFSSRTKPNMGDPTIGKIPGLVLDSKTSTDISSYVRTHLNDTTIKVPPGQDLLELEALFIGKADGCWLWAEFAVKALDKTHYTLADLIQELENIPSQLYGLFDSFWDKIDPRHIEETNNMLAVVLAAEVALDLEDFRYIMALGVGKHYDSQSELQQQLDFVQDDGTMWSRIQERCSYFLELKVDKTEDVDNIPKGNVQFYHSSLKEYLTQTDKSTKRAVLPYAELSKKGHQIIGRACLSYLRFAEVQMFRSELDSAQESHAIQDKGAVIKRIPLVFYCGVFALLHSCRIIQQDDLLADEVERFWTPSQFDGWLTIFRWASKMEAIDESCTMISFAIQEGADVFVRRMIEHGVVDVNETIPTWGHYLTLAAYLGEFKIVKLLLELEDPVVDIDAQGGIFCNALQAAAYQGHKDIVQLLLDNDADPHITGGKLQSPLCAAAYSWDFELVELLMTHPKCISTSFHDQWHNSQALLYVSLGGGDDDRIKSPRPKNSSTVVKLIARRGFDNSVFVSIEVPLVMWLLGGGSMDVMRMLVQDPRYIHARSSDGYTLLHVALAFGTLDMAKMLCEKLLETTSSLDILDREDCTPIHYAAINQDVKVLKYVLEQTSNDVDVNACSASRITPLHAAFAISSKAHINLLRSVGANHEIVGSEGLTLLHFAMSNYAHTDQLEVLPELLPLDIEACDAWERTPLHIAAQYGSLENVKWLLDHKAKIKAVDDEGRTVLHAACQNFTSHATAIIDLLVEKGLSFSACDHGGSTPLHRAFHEPKHIARNLFWLDFVLSPFDSFSESSCNRTVSHILSNKLADLSSKDNSGHTPLHLACWRGLPEPISTMVCLGARLDTENSLGSAPLDLVEDPDLKRILEVFLPLQTLSLIPEVDSDVESARMHSSDPQERDGGHGTVKDNGLKI